MKALTVGVTTARFPDCKRGLAVNLAASLARDPSRRARICVVDADPLTLDVSTRLAVRGPCVEDFVECSAPASAALGSVHEPPLWVLPSSGAGVGLTTRSAARALRQLRSDFDVVICDLVGPLGAGGIAGRFDQLDWLLVAVTPDVEPVEAAAAFLERLDDARREGDIPETLQVGIVTTGDEATPDLGGDVVASRLRGPVLGSVRQLWGRAAPNLGFGAALGIAELDDAVGAIFERMAAPVPFYGASSRRA